MPSRLFFVRRILPIQPFLRLARNVVSLWGLMRRISACLALIGLILAAAGCREEGVVLVKSIQFSGVTAVDEGRLRDALATKASSKLPWGRKRFFDRKRFDADLQRIQAFYADRGYPDAQVTGFDVQLNDSQDAVDVTLTISEGEPIRVAAVTLANFESVPADHLEELRARLPLKVGEPRDRQLVVAVYEMAINELKDHGFPYAKVTVAEEGVDQKQATVTFTALPGKLAYVGDVTIVGNNSVGNRVIERQLTFQRGD